MEIGVVAHLVEHLVRNQKVVGSSPIYSTKKENALAFSFCVVDGPKRWVVGEADGCTTSPIYSTSKSKTSVADGCFFLLPQHNIIVSYHVFLIK